MAKTVRGYYIRTVTGEQKTDLKHAWAEVGTLPEEWEQTKADPQVREAQLFSSTQRNRQHQKRRILQSYPGEDERKKCSPMVKRCLTLSERCLRIGWTVRKCIMKKFHLSLPKFALPPSGVPVGKVLPLATCSICNHVLCSCGQCHNSQQCNQACLYETGEKESPDFEEMSEHLRQLLQNRLES